MSILVICAAGLLATASAAVTDATDATNVAIETGTLHRKSLAAGGWRLAVDGDPVHRTFDAIVAAGGGRVLLLESATSAGGRARETRAGIAGVDGRVLAAPALPGMRPLDAALSPDGRVAFVLAERWRGADDTRPLLIAFDATGARGEAPSSAMRVTGARGEAPSSAMRVTGAVLWQRPAEPGDRIVAGDGWVALAAPRGGAFETETGDSRAMRAAPRRVAPRVLRLDGSTLRSADPRENAPAGDICRVGAEGMASVTGGTLVLHAGESLAPRARVALGFPEGRPFAALDGSMIAVGEERVDAAPLPGVPRRAAHRRLRLFDGRGRALGEVAIASGTGVDAAVAPDGAAVLATASVVGAGGPRGVASAALEIVLAGRDGTVRWKRAFVRRSPGDRIESLGLSAGGARAVVVLRSGDPARADRVAVLDAHGKTVWSSEGELLGATLDASGAWLTLVERGAVVRARVDDLARGTAWPAAQAAGTRTPAPSSAAGRALRAAAISRP